MIDLYVLTEGDGKPFFYGRKMYYKRQQAQRFSFKRKKLFRRGSISSYDLPISPQTHIKGEASSSDTGVHGGNSEFQPLLPIPCQSNLLFQRLALCKLSPSLSLSLSLSILVCISSFLSIFYLSKREDSFLPSAGGGEMSSSTDAQKFAFDSNDYRGIHDLAHHPHSPVKLF